MSSHPENITVAKVFADEAPVVASLAQEIWQEYFTPIIGAEQVAYMLDKFQSASAIQEQLDNGFHYYLAYIAGAPVAYVAFKAEGDAVFVSKLYVKADWRKQGVGKQLFSFVRAFAKFNGKEKIYLTVNKHNQLAIDAYTAMGFESAAAVVADIGGGFVMDDYRMELMLEK